MLFYIAAVHNGKREVVKVDANTHVEAVSKTEQWAKEEKLTGLKLTGSVLTLAPTIH